MNHEEGELLREAIYDFRKRGKCGDATALAEEFYNIVRTVQNIKEEDCYSKNMARNYHSLMRSIKNIQEIVV